MRRILSKSQKSREDLVTPEEALKRFNENGGDFSLTVPAGTGPVSWQNVYPGNQAKTKNAIITDYILSYLENPADVKQKSLVAMYTIRGIATLESGYTVRFVKTLPALKSGESVFAIEKQAVAGASTKILAQANKKSLQLKPYYPSGTIIPSPTRVAGGEIDFPTPTPGKNQLAGCPTWTNGTTKSIQVEGLGQMVVAYNQEYYSGDPTKPNDRHGAHTFFFRSATFPLSDIEDVRNKFFFGANDLTKPPGPFEKQLMINVARRAPNLTATTVDQMFALFKELNFPATNEPCDVSSRRLEPMAPPDIRNCNVSPDSPEGKNVDVPRIKKLGDNVAKRLLQAKQAGTLSSLANEPDVFPRETMTAFSYLFGAGTRYAYSGERHDTFVACYITGTSPVLYLYPEKPTQVTVQTTAPLTYTDPSTIRNTWSVLAHPDGSITSSNTHDRPYIYYEYNHHEVAVSTPEEGFIVEKKNWEKKVHSLATTLQLTEAETTSLVSEIQTVISSFSEANYLKLSIANQKEINQKLPLTISPIPNKIYRIHFAITPLKTNKIIKEQPIEPITRKGFTVVELGAYRGE
jgi:hypothetical protein